MDNEFLLNRIREVIQGRLDGSLVLDDAHVEYKNLLAEYYKLEKKYLSDDAAGFINGLLYHHKKINNTNLSALYVFQHNNPVLLAFYGDTVLMRAMPEIINREYGTLEDNKPARILLTREDDREFFLMLKKINIHQEIFLIAAVTSSESFNDADFIFLSELFAMLKTKNSALSSPVILNYINDISSEISRIVNGAKGISFFIDHFFLLNPYEAFAHIGIYPMLDFSNFIVDTLKKTYPTDVSIFALSIFKYLVLYDENIKKRLDLKRNKIDFIFQGNSIPYKVLQKEISSPQALYMFLEEL